MKAYSNGLAKPVAAGTIDLRNQKVYNPSAIPSKSKIDLREWLVDEPEPLLDRRVPAKERAEAFYEFQPSTITAADLIWDQPRTRLRAFANPVKANWWAAAIVGAAVLCGILFNVIREGTAQRLPTNPVQTKSASPPQESPAETKTSGTEREADADRGNVAALPPSPAPSGPDQSQTESGTGGSGGGGTGDPGGTGGGSLDPAVDVCVTVPGSTICQSVSIDPLAEDPVRVSGTDL